jgi:hypothetical protein
MSDSLPCSCWPSCWVRAPVVGRLSVMVGLHGSGGRRLMTGRRVRGLSLRAVLVLGLVVGAGCSADPAEPVPVVLKYAEGVRFAAAAGGAVYAADSRGLYVIPARPEPGVTVSPTVPEELGGSGGRPYVLGLARDLSGAVWMTAQASGETNTVSVSAGGPTVHQADSRVAGLTGEGRSAVPALPPYRGSRSISAVAVPDAGSMLVATSQTGLSDNGDEGDVILWRVTTQGATAVAGRVTPVRNQRPSAGPRHLGLLRRPAQDLTEGESVPATSVDLQQIEAMLPLGPRRTLLVTQGQAPKDETGAGRGPKRLFLFVLDGDRLSRIEAPAVALDVDRPVLSPLAGGRVLMVSGWVEGSGQPASTDRTWSVLDLVAGTVRRIGQDRGIGVGDGSDSYTAISPTRSAARYTSLVRRLPVPQ